MSKWTKLRCRTAMLTFVFALMTAGAHAGGPRWITGHPYFTSEGRGVPFYTSTPLYYTDPGILNANVTHAQADAMVAAAASAWNLPTSLLTISQGGELNEHVSGANSYFDGNGIVFPADVMASNYNAKPVAIVYDTDGNVTDLLLGSGASDPSGCRQNGVTESVDQIASSGVIQHALLILNGRCVGQTPQQLTQMQYQLMRAFGRVLGVGWSQLNDNVFTGLPVSTLLQQDNWPVMHPIDIVCGPYTYQCMRNPFTLREDEVSVMAGLYPVTAQNIVAGKTASEQLATGLFGTVAFPDGSGMNQVNVLIYRLLPFTEDSTVPPVLSAISGTAYAGVTWNPVNGSPAGIAESAGYPMFVNQYKGAFQVARMALTGTYLWNFVLAKTEPINPLYSGEYAVGPYVGQPIAMSGAPVTVQSNIVQQNYGLPLNANQPSPVASCNDSQNGTESVPGAVDPNGWWSAQMCSYGDAAWRTLAVKAGHAWAIEVTALDENGIATLNKMQPVIGVWEAGDTTWQMPTVAAAPFAMNSATVGTTQLVVPEANADAGLSMAIADMRGAGRPDFAYTARVLYAASVSPSLVSTDGGTITVSGMGFRDGNRVVVNGVVAQATSWTANTIVVTLPSMLAAGASDGVAVEVDVIDMTTGSTATVPAAFAYSSTVPTVRNVVTMASPRYLAAKNAASWTMSVTATQNGAAAVGVPVNWTVSASEQVSATATLTDATGTATVSVLTNGLASGAVATVSGCAWTTACASASANGVDASQWTVAVASGAGQSVSVASTFAPVMLAVTDGAGHPLQSAPMMVYQTVTAWQGPCPSTGRCPAAPVLASSQTALVSDANGSVIVVPLAVANTAGTTNIDAATGTNGFVTMTLVRK